jgi:hypothetical protein
MNISLSSRVTTPFYYVFPGQGDFNGNPQLALESLLTSYGLLKADEWVVALEQWVNHSVYGLVKLVALVDPGLAQLEEPLRELWSGQREDLTAVTEYLGYAEFDASQQLDPIYLVRWFSEQQPILKTELLSLLTGDLLSFLTVSVQRITHTTILDLGSATASLAGLLGQAYAPVALGHLPTQQFYFPYVSQIQASS